MHFFKRGSVDQSIRRGVRVWAAGAIVTSLLAAAPAPSLAVTTAVNIDESGAYSTGFNAYVSNEGGTRVSVVDILNHVYGTTFNVGLPVGDTNQILTTQTLSNGSDLSAVRVDLDEIWRGDFIAASAEARYAGYAQQFGYLAGASGGSYTNLFNVTGSGFAVSGSASTAAMGASPFEDDSDFRWARSGDGQTWSSALADNAGDLLDHMVAYEIAGLTGGAYTPPSGYGYRVYMLFWEDLPGLNNDRDYNDLAVEVVEQYKLPVTGGDPPVPEPVTMSLFGLGALALGMAMKRRD